MTPEQRDLDRMYRMIPDFQCIEGCSDCCGPIALAKPEYEALPVQHEHTCGLNGLKCPYIQDGRCSVYSQRPLICRLFGVVANMQCPHRPSEKVLSPKKERKLRRLYLEFVKKHGHFMIAPRREVKTHVAHPDASGSILVGKDPEIHKQSA